MIGLIKDLILLQRLAIFCRKLSHSLEAGLSLERALYLFSQEETHPEFKRRLQSLLTDLESGRSFAISFSQIAPYVLPMRFTEESPIVDIRLFLMHCATYLEKRHVYLISLFKQLFYPAVLLLSAISVSILFFTTLLPHYLYFFSGLNLKPPAFLMFLMSLRRYMGLFFGVSLLLLAGLWLQSKQITSFIKSRFLQTRKANALWLLSLLLSSGLSFKLAIQSIYFGKEDHLGVLFLNFKETLFESGDFSHAIGTHLSLSPYQNELILASQRTGRLPEALQDVASDIYTLQEMRTRRFLGFLQPALLLIMGIFVFGFVYLTFIPILEGLTAI